MGSGAEDGGRGVQGTGSNDCWKQGDSGIEQAPGFLLLSTAVPLPEWATLHCGCLTLRAPSLDVVGVGCTPVPLQTGRLREAGSVIPQPT